MNTKCQKLNKKEALSTKNNKDIIYNLVNKTMALV